jgi:hypothetical protein
MTKNSRTKLGLSLLALVVVSAPSAGCSSSKFSMPKMSMFSWNRKPDAATLAGNTQPAGLPVSPAAKYDPSALASTTGKSSTSTTGSAYGYGATGNGTGGALAGQTTQPGQSGLAASANGYQTGPYQLAPKTGAAPATTVASTATTGMVPGGGLPSPYGGTYTGATSGTIPGSTSKSDVQLPNSVMTALNTGTSASPAGFGSTGLPALPPATVGGSSTSTPALPVGYSSTIGAPTSASTSAYQMPSPSNYTGSSTTLPSLPGMQTGSPLGTPTSGANPSGLPAYPNQPSGSAASATLPSSTTLPSSATLPSSTSSAYQGATTLGTFSPGSTGRSTSYDFSGNAGATSSGSTSSLPSGGSPTGGSSLLR